MKAGAGHSAFYVFVLHELLPHEAAAMIFRHQHGDAEVEAEHVAVVPVRKRIERIAETVLRPNFFAIRPAKIAQHADAVVEEKRERTARGAGNDAAIDRTNRAALRVRAAPRRVPLSVIGRADAPKISAVVGKA